MKDKNIIGLGGVPGAGKDLFYSLISQKIDVKRFSLADELKRETYAGVADLQKALPNCEIYH